MLVLSLRPAVTVRDTIVRVDTVATLRGGSTRLRQMIAGLDLADLSSGENRLVIIPEHISYRLQIAGIDTRAFRIEGQQTVVTVAAQELTEDSLIAAATRLIRERLPKNAGDVDIQLCQPIRLPAFKVRPQDRIRLSADLPAGQGLFGTVQVPVAVFLNAQRQGIVPVSLAVSYVSEATAAVKEQEPKEGPILVKPHDMVRMVAQIGAMRITALGEALQEGRAGQTIRVQNVDSKKIIAARVIERQLVEVDY